MSKSKSIIVPPLGGPFWTPTFVIDPKRGAEVKHTEALSETSNRLDEAKVPTLTAKVKQCRPSTFRAGMVNVMFAAECTEPCRVVLTPVGPTTSMVELMIRYPSGVVKFMSIATAVGKSY
jgi:hypothetical protein